MLIAHCALHLPLSRGPPWFVAVMCGVLSAVHGLLAGACGLLALIVTTGAPALIVGEPFTFTPDAAKVLGANGLAPLGGVAILR